MHVRVVKCAKSRELQSCYHNVLHFFYKLVSEVRHQLCGGGKTSYCRACPYAVCVCMQFHNPGGHGRFYILDFKKRKWLSWKTSHGGF